MIAGTFPKAIRGFKTDRTAFFKVMTPMKQILLLMCSLKRMTSFFQIKMSLIVGE